MKIHLELISTAEQVASVAKTLSEHSIIGFDTEFIRESTFFPIVEIIQVATDSESWLIDAQAFKRNHQAGDPYSFEPGLKPLLDIFEDRRILKIVHAAQGDQECLYTSFGVVASPTLDTAVAASLCGYGDAIGLAKLLKSALDVTLSKGHARTNWSVRPLPAQLVEYAHADVIYLVQLTHRLMTQLDEVGRRAWALEASAKWEDKSYYQTDIAGMTQKLARSGRLDKRGYAALLGLVKWREERVRQLNLPRRWVADDHVLVDLANVRPQDKEHLGAFRGINRGELKNSAEAILKAIHETTEAEGVAIQKTKALVPSAEESQALELLACFIGVLADQHKIAAKHLLTTAKLLPLLRSQISQPSDLVKLGFLSEEASLLIGSELLSMLEGKRALTIRGNEICVIKIETN